MKEHKNKIIYKPLTYKKPTLVRGQVVRIVQSSFDLNDNPPDDCLYIVSYIGHGYTLINLTSGNRWAVPQDSIEKLVDDVTSMELRIIPVTVEIREV